MARRTHGFQTNPRGRELRRGAIRDFEPVPSARVVGVDADTGAITGAHPLADAWKALTCGGLRRDARSFLNRVHKFDSCRGHLPFGSQPL